MEENRIPDLEILAQHLQQHLSLYEDHISMEKFMEGIGKYEIKGKKNIILKPSQLQGFLEHKKAKDMYAKDYDYHGRNNGYYRNDDYYERQW